MPEHCSEGLVQWKHARLSSQGPWRSRLSGKQSKMETVVFEEQRKVADTAVSGDLVV